MHRYFLVINKYANFALVRPLQYEPECHYALVLLLIP